MFPQSKGSSLGGARTALVVGWAEQRRQAEVKDEQGRTLELSYCDLQPEKPQWDTPMVFIHGAAGHFSQWAHQLDFFSSRCRCLALDLRGHGQSHKPDWSDYGAEVFAEDLLMVLEHAQVAGPIILVGHSFGGAVATVFTLRHPDKVAKLALLSTTGTLALGFHVLALMKMPAFMLHPIQKFFQKRVGAPVPVLKKLVPKVDAWDGWDLYPQIGVPTLVMCGELDKLTKPKQVRRMAEAIPQVHYEGIGFSAHLPQLERPQRVNEALLTFVRGKSERPF